MMNININNNGKRKREEEKQEIENKGKGKKQKYIIDLDDISSPEKDFEEIKEEIKVEIKEKKEKKDKKNLGSRFKLGPDNITKGKEILLQQINKEKENIKKEEQNRIEKKRKTK
jgi:hypothetical protein